MGNENTEPVSRQLGPWGWGVSIAVGVAVGTVAFMVIASVLTGHATQESLISAHGVFVDSPSEELSSEEMQHLSGLIRGGHVLTGQNLVSEIARYYNGVINTLLVAFTVLGIIAFISVRSMSLERAEDTAQQASRRQVEVYFNSQEFRDISERIVTDETADLLDSARETLEELESERDEWSPDALENLKRRLVQIERRIASLDVEDEVDISDELELPEGER